MKLDKYVEETIKQIITGISAAKEFGDRNDAKVNPASATFNHQNSTNIFCLNTGVPIQKIEFDIVVSVSEGNSTTDSPEITVGSSTISGNEQTSETTNSSTNRIKFSIPVLLPLSGTRR
ncbi:hypothetical protein EXT66_13530 [Pectobacterium carotovorum subsp. carotovorum]|uniref:hypothetical protein n=1 Tax=Pectobacterium versatile TaxID=2488639 RepID=UPI00202D49BF|nr:hypothetical protein [Pectobacterium carotovorum]MCL6334322.1 hypothetical protein [Pectobacterium carotovorum subsp. carotovorum]MCL6347152.1 hypothetical protein [Pectobacterium carotovorum subsp. carotovorum]MCL6402281.1 hypothetical protein [Pectobacterium carotovorum subsp. carotovorum]